MTFKLKIEKTYYNQGFFNITVEFDKHVSSIEKEINLYLIYSKDDPILIEGKINRSANSNGTPRIMGGAKLKKWFQKNFKIGDTVDIKLPHLGHENDMFLFRPGLLKEI